MRILKEPLFHFILIGIAIFGWFYLISPKDDATEPNETITIDQRDVETLIARFEANWRRTPSTEEVEALVDGLIREKVLVREAQKLGLDRGDPVIRTRLSQKMDFLTEALALSVTPEDDVLEAYLAENTERYALPPQIAFDQVFLGNGADTDEVKRVLAVLRSGDDPVAVGAASLLPASLPLTATRVVDATFGAGFSRNLRNMQHGQWVGPVQSGYGQHLVRVVETTPGKVPALEAIRETILQDWRRATGADLARAQYESLAEQYDIVRPPKSGAGE